MGLTVGPMTRRPFTVLGRAADEGFGDSENSKEKKDGKTVASNGRLFSGSPPSC
jgi:hypothetical protein